MFEAAGSLIELFIEIAAILYRLADHFATRKLQSETDKPSP